ncbi:ABC-F family ATP-binding cassette domain-containing protein [Sulfurospirillum barnesii]|uniref:ATPase component of ABC transporters with duplicated ATPase domain n=1 Tax=Sulfurospirillum barnesii (strain ATCC 700032 / DSM 10660 / SES-3) TaxID=760154 RepID=I3XXW2_SULBS|nr:ABC-F family ATP-binding cassette domain-containing protein [Sulfurospirillum barnesii]AFL68786.1 ATPase component of ABC transporters with duplicated ATPase domain [Sulfurospirillum barnesii SES-3]
MALLDLIGISKAYETQQILSSIDFSLHEKERVAIIGKNGGGKSTLMKLIYGSLESDEGRRILQKNIKVGMLDQTPRFKEGMHVKEAIEEALKELKDAKLRYDEILKTLEKDFENTALLHEQSELVSYLDIHDAWSLDEKIEQVMYEFDLKQFENSDVNLLSGGEQRRVTLAGLILQKPDILLLDEPTNHLDVYMVEFLEEMILKGKFTLLFISHDRYFIDHIATRTIEIDDGMLRSFEGGYENYLTCKELLILSLQKQHENLLKYLKGEEEWLRRGVKARLKRNEGRKQRVFELRENAKKNPSLVKKLKLELEREKHNFNGEKIVNKQKMLFEIYNIHKKLGDKLLIKDFSTRILQKDRIAIVGKNGAGKSTLLKILLGDMTVDSGKFDKGEFKVGYFDQQRLMLDENKNLIETFCPNGGDRVDVKGKNIHVFGYLKDFLFPKEDLNKKIGVLSGGEKNRVALALLFAQEVDCLILDEPTNDLDIPTINILEEYIQSFSGAVIFVSHDRYFVDKIANKLYVFKGEGLIEESYQSYSEYLEIEKEIKELEGMEASTHTVTPLKEEPKTLKNKESIPTKLSYKEQRLLETLPVHIQTLEDEIKEIKRCLSNPECYQRIGLTQLSQTLEEKEALLEPLIEELLLIEEKAEIMQKGF